MNAVKSGAFFMQPRPTGISRAGLIFFVSFFYQEKKENRD